MAKSARANVGTKPQVESWFAKITEDIAAIVKSGDFIEPTPPAPEEGDATVSDDLEGKLNLKILGEMSPTMKALFTLWQQEAHLQFRIMVDAIDPRHRMTTNDVLRQTRASDSRASALKSMFWAEVESQFTAPENMELSVCQGFKVVQLPPRHGGHLILHKVFQGLDGFRELLDS